MMQLTNGAVPGLVAASAQSTMPARTATPKAYACSQPRMRGLPMSTGLSRVVVVMPSRLRERRLLTGSEIGHAAQEQRQRSLAIECYPHGHAPVLPGQVAGRVLGVRVAGGRLRDHLENPIGDARGDDQPAAQRRPD